MTQHSRLLTLPNDLKGGVPKRPRWADANSIASFKTLAGDKHQIVFDVFWHSTKMLTDRDVKRKLLVTDMDYVRPRITELLEFGFLVKVGNMIDSESGKKVRACMVNRNKFKEFYQLGQMTFPGMVRQEVTGVKI
jgi:hypothetical protein